MFDFQIVPTGKIIKEYLEERNITQKELCARIGSSERHISNFLNGKVRLTEEFALKLEKVMPDINASYWLNYESKYREQLARLEEKYNLSQQNLKETSKRFAFDEVFSGLTLVEQAYNMLKLLRISSFNDFDGTYEDQTIFYMHNKGDIEKIAIWLNICKNEITIQNKENLGNILFDKENLINIMLTIKDVLNNEDFMVSFESLRILLNKQGVYIVLCDALINSKIRGALTTYFNNPVIYLSTRLKRSSHLIFAFLHELAHLILHYNKKQIYVSLEDNDDCNKLEIEANEYAKNFLINKNDYEFFCMNKKFDEGSILRFSNQQNVIPGIVVNRLAYDKLIEFNQYKKWN